MSWSTSELRLSLALLNRFKPSSKIFYWPFQGGSSFVYLLCFCSVLCLLCFCARLLICALWSPAGKGLTSWLLLWCLTVSLSLSHCYPGSGVVLDCIDSWSLHPYLLYLSRSKKSCGAGWIYHEHSLYGRATFYSNRAKFFSECPKHIRIIITQHKHGSRKS